MTLEFISPNYLGREQYHQTQTHLLSVKMLFPFVEQALFSCVLFAASRFIISAGAIKNREVRVIDEIKKNLL